MANVARLKELLRTEVRHLTTINPTDRPWQLALAAALAAGLPLFIGAWFDHLAYGLVGSLGGLVFFYLPNTPMHHRMVLLMTCSFGMAASYCFGLLCHFVPQLMVPVLTFIAILVTMITRYFGLGPPGSLFFVMAASIGAFTPVKALDVPLMVGLMTMGCIVASLTAFFYSVFTLRLRAPAEVAPLPVPTFDFVVFDSIVIGAFVGIALALAQALQLDKPYWVPISCLAVIQGVSFRAVWNRQLQRIIGTVLGLFVAFGLLKLPMDKWTISIAVMALTAVIELTVVRHYALATMFITPLTILLAEAATMGHTPVWPLIEARFFDTLLGCLVGLAGGACLHSPAFRRVLGKLIKAVVPARFKP